MGCLTSLSKGGFYGTSCVRERLNENHFYAKIEVVVRITKDHCPPQEQTIFEWIEMNRAAPDTLNYPGLEINLEHRRVFKNGQEVYMSRYEYGVLSLMARHPGQLFTKEQIFEAVWHQDSESCLTAVTNTIGRIRQKSRMIELYLSIFERFPTSATNLCRTFQ